MHEILELAVHGFLFTLILGLVFLFVLSLLRSHPGGDGLGGIAVYVAILGISLGPSGGHLTRTHAFKGLQSLSHHGPDGRVLLVDSLFQTDGVDLQADLAHSWIRSEGQGGHHQPDAQIVVSAHGGTFALVQVPPGP